VPLRKELWTLRASRHERKRLRGEGPNLTQEYLIDNRSVGRELFFYVCSGLAKRKELLWSSMMVGKRRGATEDSQLY